ncbi:CHAT domain-containing protein [Pseudorhodoferax sp. Leaf267]|uniref:CHAT domain-containing protein n=1 Tax=Pseudorhodoferax sp. Leaf267 TaxID=1736316 RepID=UPI00070065DF|nr:CHAT domain-containing protein [Pseudorhodoferax sp. Leaf267]KQP18257.1 hypothetical protein ASF43_10545 [Pseudorhodoferax sp. Leaf267]
MNRYQRRDIRLDIVARASEALLRRTDGDGTVVEAMLPRAALDSAAAGDADALRDALAPFAAQQARPVPTLADLHGSFTLDRVTLALGEASWSAINWEGLINHHATFVRVTDVLARVARLPLTFPLRLLESGGTPVVAAALHDTFLYSDRSQALVDAAVAPAALEGYPHAQRWPTVDVLHLRSAALVLRPDGRPAPWLAPFVERYQTRLLVIECESAAAPAARRLAQALVERAGPAVWLMPATDDPQVWAWFYAHLSHDRPLDWSHAHLAVYHLPCGALFVGGGREELLRYSTLAEALRSPAANAVELAPDWRGDAPPEPVASPRLTDTVRRAAARAVASSAQRNGISVVTGQLDLGVQDDARLVRFGASVAARLVERGIHAPAVDAAIARLRHTQPSIDALASAASEGAVLLSSLRGSPAAAAVVTTALDDIGALTDLRYENHESEGMLPLASKLAVARKLAQRLGGLRPVPSGAARHVNIGFFAPDGDTGLRRLSPDAALDARALVHLGVQIGPLDELVVSLGSSALLEEIDRSRAALALEVGVSGLEFEVIGNPVQALLLEPGLASDLLAFAVRPAATTTVPGVARLRVSLFRSNHVVQSFLVAARLSGADAAHAALASALAVDVSEIDQLAASRGALGHVQRLEFSMATAADAERLPPRGLTLLANDSGGEKVVTLKSNDLFVVARSRLFEPHIVALRAALNDMTSDAAGFYPYQRGAVENQGDPGRLVQRLWRLARAGWALCSVLLHGEDEREAVRALMLRDGGLQAAHMLASDVIPWSLVYDRPVRSEAAIPAGEADTPALCPAGMPAADEGPGAADCGHREACLLHAQQQQLRREKGLEPHAADMVLCPLRFWGYRVPIEVPAHQVHGVAGRDPPPLQTTITAGSPLRFGAVFNPNLRQAEDHHRQIAEDLGALAKRKAELVGPGLRVTQREDALALLRQTDLDLVYLYCHGLKSVTGGGRTAGPGLDFGLAHDATRPRIDDLIAAADLYGPQWQHAPLVFMNGCHTAAFNDYAPSELVLAFVRERRAAAVVGTEVTTVEVLAREFARRFFAAFIDRGTTAGQALLAARRELLAKNNPLGLIYTLYGSSNLVLESGRA